MSESEDPRVLRSRAAALQAARALMLREGLDAVTHLRVARESGLGRKTMYRHWPDREALLTDALSTDHLPYPAASGVLRDDLCAHLESLRVALVEGPLAFVLAALVERSFVDPATFGALRKSLSSRGCARIRQLLGAAVKRGDLAPSLDLVAAAAELEGPIFYRALILGERPSRARVPVLVDAFLRAHAA